MGRNSQRPDVGDGVNPPIAPIRLAILLGAVLLLLYGVGKLVGSFRMIFAAKGPLSPG